jgi:hypothetical protein
MSNNKNFKVKNGLEAPVYENLGTISSTASTVYFEKDPSLAFTHTFSYAYYGIAFKPDGTKVYYSEYLNDTISEFSLSTPWDLSTVGASPNYTYDISAIEVNPRGLAFKSDGTKMYVSNSAGYIRVFDLSTAWDLSTASGGTTYATPVVGGADALQFKPDGTKMYVDKGTYDLAQYTLTTPWDVSTATLDQTVTPYSTQFFGQFAINHDGTVLIILRSFSSTIRQLLHYSLATPWDIGTRTLVSTYNYHADFATLIAGFTFNSEDSTSLYVARGSQIIQLDLSIQQKQLDLSSGSYFEVEIDENLEAGFINPPAAGKIGEALVKVSTNSASTNASSITPTGVWSSTAISYGAWGITVSSDGTRLILSSNPLRQFKLGVPWDISTVYDYSVTSNVTDTQMGGGIAFADNGNKLWLKRTADLSEYTLSTPYDITTMTFSQSVTGLFVSVNNLFVANNDSKIYITNGGLVYEYTLSTPGDPSTATLTNSFNTGYSSTYGVHVSSDGTKMYVNAYDGTNYRAASYTLSTAWDVTSATLVSAPPAFAASASHNYFSCVVSPDGRRIITTGYDATPTNFKIHQHDYTVDAIYRYSGNVKYNNNQAPDIPAISGSDFILFTTTDGGSTYYGKTLLKGVY